MSSIAEQLGIHIDLYAVLIFWGLIFTRIFVMLLLNPFLGSKAVPGRIRMGTAFALSIFLYPLLTHGKTPELPDEKALVLALYFKEVFFGMCVGMVTTMLFYAMEAAGKIVDHQRGGGNAEMFLPQLGQVSIFGLFNYWLAIGVFLSIGGHRMFLQAFMTSFVTFPVLQLPHMAAGFSPFLDLMIRLSGNVLVIAVQVSAPVIITAFLVDTILGITNKMAPQVNVFDLGFAIRGYATPLMIWVSLAILVDQMKFVMTEMIASVSHLAIVFAQ